MDYLAVLRIIFLAVNKSEQFTRYFNGEMKEKKIRILDYFIQMYNSGIDELKIMATELILSTPFELKFFMSRYPEHAGDMISIVTFGPHRPAERHHPLRHPSARVHHLLFLALVGGDHQAHRQLHGRTLQKPHRPAHLLQRQELFPQEPQPPRNLPSSPQASRSSLE